jgi:ubiquitin-protein ligase
MARASIIIPVGEGRIYTFSIPDELSEEEIKAKFARDIGWRTASFSLQRSPGISRTNYVLTPSGIQGGVDEELLRDEYAFLRHQFPLVTMVNLTTYEGMARCEGGPIMELADDGVWPFEQYVTWHKFKIKLSFLHPYKPPTVTWTTDIDHPNIIPKRSGKVCVSLLGKGWLPQTKLAAVINSLYFLLYDPNPYSHYPNKRCKRAAEVCKQYGFPRKRGGVLSRHENTFVCPNCRRPFIIEDADAKVIQCIHCKIILRRRPPGAEDEEDQDDDDYDDDDY